MGTPACPRMSNEGVGGVVEPLSILILADALGHCSQVKGYADGMMDKAEEGLWNLGKEIC